MNRVVLAFSVLLVLALSTVVPRVGPVESHSPLVYKVQITDSPKVRWGPIMKDFKEPLSKFLDYFDLLPIPKGFFDGVQWFAKNQFKYQDFVSEVQAIAYLTDLPFERLFFINFMYEFSTFKACTAIMLRNDEGKILHGRNLDFEMWEIIAKLVVNVEYYRGEEKLFTIDYLAGSVFAATGVKNGAFSINANTRKAKDFSQDLISILVKNSIPSIWLIKRIFQEQTTYKGALNRLKTQPISAPVYYNIAGIGPNEGAVIEREVDSVHGFYQLNETNWFIIQTNYDRDELEPVYDPRRIPVQNKMRARGNKGLTEQVLIDEFMFKWPTFNIGSIMTAIISPKTGYHNTTVWYGLNPHGQQSTK